MVAQRLAAPPVPQWKNQGTYVLGATFYNMRLKDVEITTDGERPRQDPHLGRGEHRPCRTERVYLGSEQVSIKSTGQSYTSLCQVFVSEVEAFFDGGYGYIVRKAGGDLIVTFISGTLDDALVSRNYMVRLLPIAISATKSIASAWQAHRRSLVAHSKAQSRRESD